MKEVYVAKIRSERASRATWAGVALVCCVGLLSVVSCSSGGEQPDAGVEETDGREDAGVDAGQDAGVDAGADAGADPGDNAGSDAGLDAGADYGVDAGADAGTDGGSDAGTDAGADGGTAPWPPKDPWWGRKQCLLPVCSTNISPPLNISGAWTQKLTALSHDCNKYLETLKPEIKPGAVTTNPNQPVFQSGECVSDVSGGATTGVMKGNILINCIVRPPENGVTAMPTGWVEFDSANHGSGESTVWLYDIPVIQPTECSIKYRVEFIRQ